MHHSSNAKPQFRLFTQWFCVMLCCLSLLFGCGGGSEGGGSTTANPGITGDAAMQPATLLTGVAATGRPLDGYVYIQDATGVTVNVPIAADGSYQADVSGMYTPFIIRAQTSDGGVWYSYAPSLVPANISQLTTLVMFIANGKADLLDLFAAWPQRHATLTAEAMLHAQAVVNLNFSGLFELNSLDYTIYNFFTTDFAADGTGFDAVLDTIGTISFGAGAYQFHNPVYQSAFDENVAATDPGMIDTLVSSFTASGSFSLIAGGTITFVPGILPGYELPVDWVDDTLVSEPPAFVFICAQTDPAGETCPEGAFCSVVECDEGTVNDGYDSVDSDSVGSVWSGNIQPPADVIDEPPPPETYVEEPLPDSNEDPDVSEAITSEEVVEAEPLIE